MLKFNPNHRFSIDECLKSPVFDKIRDPSKEIVATSQIETTNNFSSTLEAGQYLIREIELIKGDE